MANLYAMMIDQDGGFSDLKSIHGSCETLRTKAATIFRSPEFQELQKQHPITPIVEGKMSLQLDFDRFKLHIGGIQGYPEKLNLLDVQAIGLKINNLINASFQTS